ncbi:pyridoxamine 5'-phosphate oxidase family protein [Lacimonas salitolerans]|uniref:Pyridoxamine 5'-phosphate oxidase family protein n=1 Tax=Lacimonas salitolerans TaxID=1323750 RepID=A0ABW4EHE5_9RHOB
MATDPHPWAADLASLQEQVWARLLRGVGDRHAPARHPTLATVSPGGWPQARTVVLRAVDVAAGTFDIHTDLRSAKVAELRATPRAALHVWDKATHLQTRAKAVVEILTGAAVADLWARVPDAARQAYGSQPAPGVPLADALAYEKRPSAASFAVLRCTVQALDVVHLGLQHRRARFDRTDGWAGQWLAP